MCVSGPIYNYVLALHKAALEESESEGFRIRTVLKNPARGRPSNFSDLYNVRETPNAIFCSGSLNFFLVLPFVVT